MPDPVAVLPDRAHFLTALGDAIAALEPDRVAAVVAIRVRGHKELELDCGYERTEAMVEKLASRIAGCLRPADILSRIGPDEFAVVLPGLKSAAQPLMAVNKILRECEPAVELPSGRFRLRIACGRSMSSAEAQDAESLMRAADLALRYAVERNLDSAAFEDCPPDMALEITPVRVATEIDDAIQDGLLESAYVPVVDILEGELFAARLEPRWSSDKWGEVGAAEIGRMAEERGISTNLAVWSLNNGMRECADWQDALGHAAVMISAQRGALRDPHLPELIQRAFRLWSGSPGQLIVEVAESTLSAEPEVCRSVFAALRAENIRVALSGFGSGAASMTVLQDLPVDLLSIDPRFVGGMLERDADRAVVQTVVDLAHNFSLEVIANGVPDEDTLDALTLMGCRYAEGRGIGDSTAAEALPGWLAGSEWETPPAGGA